MNRFHFEVAGAVRDGASLTTEYVVHATNDKEGQQLARLRYAQEFPEYLPVRYVAWTGYEKGDGKEEGAAA